MEKRKSQEVTRERAAWETVMETGNGVDAKQIESLAMPTCVPMLHSGKKTEKESLAAFHIGIFYTTDSREF